VCGNLPQLAEYVRLATPLARFGKIVRTATNQKVGSSNLSGRATFPIFLLTRRSVFRLTQRHKVIRCWRDTPPVGFFHVLANLLDHP
jgi:hypothetical protein